MKIIKQVLLLSFLFFGLSASAQDWISCDDFTDLANWSFDGEFGEDSILGYTQSGTYEVICEDGHGWINNMGEENGISIGTGTVNFAFSGSNQNARFKVYHIGLDENMGFSVNGSSFTYFDASFPLSIAGVTVDLDTSPIDPAPGDPIFGELSYLTFSGEINDISIYALEGGIVELCVDSLHNDLACDDFTDLANWSFDGVFGEDSILGYTQDGTYEVICEDGHGWINNMGEENGISIGTGTVNFAFSGSNQNARFKVYHIGLDENMGFSVNGSSFTYFDASFPLSISGVTVDLDTSPIDPAPGDPIFGELSYLTFSGEINDISIYALEGGIVELCVEENANSEIEDIPSNSISIYPNPVDALLTLTSREPLGSIKIYNLSGEIVLDHTPTNGTSEQIDLSSLEAGFYVVVSTNLNGQNTVSKVTKN